MSIAMLYALDFDWLAPVYKFDPVCNLTDSLYPVVDDCEDVK